MDFFFHYSGVKKCSIAAFKSLVSCQRSSKTSDKQAVMEHSGLYSRQLSFGK